MQRRTPATRQHGDQCRRKQHGRGGDGGSDGNNNGWNSSHPHSSSHSSSSSSLAMHHSPMPSTTRLTRTLIPRPPSPMLIPPPCPVSGGSSLHSCRVASSLWDSSACSSISPDNNDALRDNCNNIWQPRRKYQSNPEGHEDHPTMKMAAAVQC